MTGEGEEEQKGSGRQREKQVNRRRDGTRWKGLPSGAYPAFEELQDKLLWLHVSHKAWRNDSQLCHAVCSLHKQHEAQDNQRDLSASQQASVPTFRPSTCSLHVNNHRCMALIIARKEAVRQVCRWPKFMLHLDKELTHNAVRCMGSETPAGGRLDWESSVCRSDCAVDSASRRELGLHEGLWV